MHNICKATYVPINSSYFIGSNVSVNNKETHVPPMKWQSLNPVVGAGPLLVTMERKQAVWTHSSRMTSKPSQIKGRERKAEMWGWNILFPSKPSLPCPWAVQYFKVAGNILTYIHHCAQADKTLRGRQIPLYLPNINVTFITERKFSAYLKWFLDYVAISKPQ